LPPRPYVDAIAAAGLTDASRSSWARKDTPTQAQRADAEALLAWGAPSGLLPHMPKLRWVQALTAGVEGWLALPDLPAQLTLTCARGTHRESMPENILGALFHLTKPYAAIVEDQKRVQWTRRMAMPLNGKTLGILGLGAIGGRARLATALRSGSARRRARPWRCRKGPATERTAYWHNPTLCCCCPGNTGNRKFHQRGTPGADSSGAWLLNFGRADRRRGSDRRVKAKRIAGAVLMCSARAIADRASVWTTEGILCAAYRRRPSNARYRRCTIVRENLGGSSTGNRLELVDREAGY
jgi:hypothetical protein